MILEFCCSKCGHVKREPSQLHEDPRNPQTCTACAVRLCKLAPSPTTEWIKPSKAEGRAMFYLGVMALMSFGFMIGFLVRGAA